MQRTLHQLGRPQTALAQNQRELEPLLKTAASQQGSKTATQAQRVDAKLRTPASAAAD